MMTGMVQERNARLLGFARKLLRPNNYADLLEVVRAEVRAAIGYNSAWLMIGEKEDPDELQLVEFEGAGSAAVRAVATRLPVRGDVFLESLIASDAPDVIPDARLDPRTNKDIVAKLGNRTLVNIPLRLVEKPFGVFGTGTFGDEGCRAPSSDELEFLVAMASQVSVAASRIMLQESRARDTTAAHYRELFDRMDVPFAYHRAIFEGEQGVDYTFMEVNAAFERVTGLQRAALLGRRASAVFPDLRTARPDLLATYGRVARTGEPAHLQLDLDPPGRSFTVTVHCPIEGHFVTVFTDVTEMRHHSQELEAINRELEAFSYSVSHDLQAPLRGIDGFTRILLEDYGDALDDRGRDYLGRLRGAAEQMTRLITDILHLSRVTRANMHWAKIDLSELAQAVFEGLLEAEPAREVRFEVAPALEVSGDRVLLRQALENILGNALKFTSRHPSAHIQLGHEQRASEEVFFVRDDGAGFDMVYADKLFRPFERLHAAHEFKGTGLGLAIVERIVHRHGGRIWIEAAVEKGATVYFTLATTQVKAPGSLASPAATCPESHHES